MTIKLHREGTAIGLNTIGRKNGGVSASYIEIIAKPKAIYIEAKRQKPKFFSKSATYLPDFFYYHS